MLKKIASINRKTIGTMEYLIKVSDELVKQYNLKSKAEILFDVVGSDIELHINVPEPVRGYGYKTNHE